MAYYFGFGLSKQFIPTEKNHFVEVTNFHDRPNVHQKDFIEPNARKCEQR